MEGARTIHNWAARLSAKDEALTLAEAQTYAAIATADRLVELLTAFQDIQMRLTRLELYMSAKAPGYEQEVSRHYAALQAGD